jgi:hypothetical protein
MIEKFEDLDLEKVETPEQVDEKIQEKLGVNLMELKEKISAYVVDKAEELTHEFVNIAPLGDYSNLLEDNDSMADFLKSEAYKPEHWKLLGIRISDVNKSLLSFEFANDAVDDGDVFKGFAYVSFSGKIRHIFAVGNDN